MAGICKVTHGLLLMQLVYVSYSANILLIPTASMSSHINYLTKIGEQLTRRGHKTVMLLSHSASQSSAVVKWKTMVSEIHLYAEAGSFGTVDFTDLVEARFNNDNAAYDKFIQTFIKRVQNETEQLLKDAKIGNIVDTGEFDMALVSGFMIGVERYILPYKYSIPYITVNTQIDVIDTPAPMLPSFVPTQLGEFTDKMTFLERCNNLLTYLLLPLLKYQHLLIEGDISVTKYAPEMPFRTLSQLATKSQFWIFNIDNVIDYARPMMPNMITIGGFSIESAKPLKDAIKQFAERASEGLVVVSFGSLVNNFPKVVMDIFIEAFSGLEYKVIWRYGGNWTINSPNIMVVPWLPQNDILGHHNTKLFITHCGTNGQMEALYHGVPMLGLPLISDQFYNCKRMDYNNFGKFFKFHELSAERLNKTIYQIIKSDNISRSVKKASTILKSRKKSAAEISADWIEHVIEFGGDYLRSVISDMPWYQIFLLDILILVLFIIAAVVILVTLCIKFSIIYIFNRKSKRD